jgi:hypothetical protein
VNPDSFGQCLQAAGTGGEDVITAGGQAHHGGINRRRPPLASSIPAQLPWRHGRRDTVRRPAARPPSAPTSQANGPTIGQSSAASSTNTSEHCERPGQDPWRSFGATRSSCAGREPPSPRQERDSHSRPAPYRRRAGPSDPPTPTPLGGSPALPLPGTRSRLTTRTTSRCPTGERTIAALSLGGLLNEYQRVA